MRCGNGAGAGLVVVEGHLVERRLLEKYWDSMPPKGNKSEIRFSLALYLVEL